MNIDLEIESKEDISLIIEEFGDRVCVMRHDSTEDAHVAVLETGYCEENEIIAEYLSLIDGLSPAARKLWDNCRKREFDVGYDSGDVPKYFKSILSKESVESIARVEGSIAISIYPVLNEDI